MAATPLIYQANVVNFSVTLHGTGSSNYGTNLINTAFQYVYTTSGSVTSNVRIYYDTCPTVTGGVYFNQYYWPQQNVFFNFGETPEQRIAREEAEIAYKKKYEAASLRAEELLLACIDEQQRKDYLEKGYFETKVKDKKYRIKKGRSGNVFQLDEKGQEKYRYCVHPYELVPDQDTMLTQLLMLHSDENKFLATANRTILHG